MYKKINNKYVIRNEKNCSFLIRVGNLIDMDSFTESVILLPPFIGYILSIIGKFEYEVSKNIISERLSISTYSIDLFVNNMMPDTAKKMKLSEEEFIIFPAKLLIESESKDERIFYNSNDFDPSDEFIPHRPSIPFNMLFMLTTKCTTNCIYCYAKRSTNDDLDTNETISIINKLKNNGVLNLSLTGGDVFARKDWRVILAELRKNGYDSFLSTKTILSKADLKYLKEIGINKFQFSLDSSNPKQLTQLISVDKSYLNKCDIMLNNCSEFGINVSLRSVLTQKNGTLKDVQNLYYFISKYKCISDWALTPALFSEFKEESKLYEIGNDELVEIYRYTKNLESIFPIIFNKVDETGYCLKRINNVDDFVKYNQRCVANTYSMSIQSNGDCTICETLYRNPEFLLGNILTDSLDNIWNSEKALFLYNPHQKRLNTEQPCYNCKVFDKCKQGFKKTICYADISKIYKTDVLSKPDPRCPMADKIDYML